MHNCILCQGDIFIGIPKTKKGTYIVGKLKKFHKEILDDNIKIKPKMCYKCAEEVIGHKIVRSLSNRERSIIYDIPFEQTKGMTKNGYSLKKSIELHGLEEGTKRFEKYRDKQKTAGCSLHYFIKKYGTEKGTEFYENLNKRKSVTLENQIKKYGIEEGTKKFNNYCIKQKDTGCSLSYFEDKYGKEQGLEFYENLNKRKAITLDNMITKYGEQEGSKRFESYINSEKGFYSKESIEFFEKELSNILLKYKVYYKDNEFGLMDKNNKTYYKYDFVVPELKICIEYNGDLFHANPIMFSEEDKPNPFDRTLNSRDIWERDEKKIDLIKGKGYKVLIIWSSDKNKNNKIENFIKENI